MNFETSQKVAHLLTRHHQALCSDTYVLRLIAELETRISRLESGVYDDVIDDTRRIDSLIYFLKVCVRCDDHEGSV